MHRALFIFGVAVVLPFIQGCSLSSSQQSQQVPKDIGGGTYSIGVTKSSFMAERSSHIGLDEAVSKAGDFCHAKGQKLADVRSVGNEITFKCAGDFTPQSKPSTASKPQ